MDSGRAEIDVVIPYHRVRATNGMLDRAIASVHAQTVPCRAITVLDDIAAGSARTRNLGLDLVESKWVAFLDSDDELDPDHLRQLTDHGARTGADLVYPWFRRAGGPDPWWERFGQEFDKEALRRSNFIAVTVLARTDVVRAAGGFRADLTVSAPAQCDEWPLWLRMLDLGAKFVHWPERTWTWHVHPRGNTSGSPLLGDARRYPD